MALAIIVVSGHCATALALDVLELDARHAADGFHVEFEATLDARVDAVDKVLRDYRAYPRLDARIQEARVLERPGPGEALLYTRLRACAGIFCRTVERVERVEERRHELEATALPERSDLRSGRTRTTLVRDGERTRVVYHSSFEPDFWVPRWIGGGLALRALETATIALFENVEREAHAEGEG